MLNVLSHPSVSGKQRSCNGQMGIIESGVGGCIESIQGASISY